MPYDNNSFRASQPSSETGRFANQEHLVAERAVRLRHGQHFVHIALPEAFPAETMAQRPETTPNTGAKILQFTARTETREPVIETSTEVASAELSIESIRKD